MSVQAPPTEAEFVADCLRMFELDASNRDIALARCLFYLSRLDRVSSALEPILPSLTAMAGGGGGGLLGRVMGRGN